MPTYNPASSAILEIDWDDETTDMTVMFTDGRAYIYPKFPWRVLTAWLAADSIGAYYNYRIRGRFGEREDVPEHQQYGNF